MKNLIEALSIIMKYGEVPCPLHAEHDIIYVGSAVNPSDYKQADLDRLEELHFHVDTENGGGFYYFT